ncbi:hypothetical protein HYDPIDRAFT_110621 [Hydnomerulius pinastri MD-312]|nr:hypothetical protein HYDPIDRAFT_110621 [Hydnomerulius pinastri MD-312]
MSDYSEPGPSISKPKNTAKSRKPRSPKKKDPVEKASMESELSSVLDEPPKKRQKKQRRDTEKPQKSEKAKREKKTKEPLSKDEETVNRLKSIVVACGVRKTWKKEFDGVEKPSQQVKRLHEILGDLGMSPRYTLEKAKTIKQQRELAQELRDVQEFDKATRRRGSRKAKDPSEAEESGAQSDNDAEELPAQKKTSARARIAAHIRNLCDED